MPPRSVLLTLLWGLVLIACASGLGRTASVRSDGHSRSCAPISTFGSDVEEIRRLELRGAEVNVEGWSIDEASGFVAPEFVSVQPDGSVLDHDSIFATFVEGRSRPWASSFVITDLDIRVIHCDAAMVVGLAEARPLGLSPDAPPLRLRFLNVWRRVENRWQYAANQWTRASAVDQ